MKHTPISVAYSAKSVADTLELTVPTGYGYLAFTAPDLDDASAAALADILKDTVEEPLYKKMLEEFGIQGGYIEGDIFREYMLMVESGKCYVCEVGMSCDTDKYCRQACDICAR